MTEDEKTNQEFEEFGNKEESVNDVASLQDKVDEYLDCWQRERASFANYKRRVEQDNAVMADRLLGEHIKLFLPVMDDLERALDHSPADPDCASWITGIELIRKKLIKTLETQDVGVIDLKPGDMFDPINQEAVTHEENDRFSDGQIIEVVQTGYQLKERVIRPAKVRVAK